MDGGVHERVPAVGVAQDPQLLVDRSGAQIGPGGKQVEGQAGLEREQDRDAPAVGLGDHPSAPDGRLVEEVDEVAGAAGGDQPECHRHAGGRCQRDHPVERDGPYVGVGGRHGGVGAFEDAGTEFTHHADQGRHLVPRGQARSHRSTVGCLVVLGPRASRIRWPRHAGPRPVGRP